MLVLLAWTLAGKWGDSILLLQSNRANLAAIKAVLGEEATLLGVVRTQQLKDAESGMIQLAQSHTLGCISRLGEKQGRINLELRSNSQAILVLQRWLETCPDDRNAWYLLGQAYEESGSWAASASAFLRAGAPLALMKQADSLARKQMWSQAAPAYLAITVLRPQDCTYLTRAGTALWRGTTDLAGAMAFFTAATRLCPENVEGYTAAARMLVENKDYTRGEQWASLGCKVDPNSEVPQVILGLSRLRQNHVDEAVRHLQHALYLNPRNPEAHALLGIAYMNSRKYDLATRELDAAIQIGPPQAWHYVALGSLYETTGHTDLAIAAYERAEQLDPAGTTGREDLERLRAKR